MDRTSALIRPRVMPRPRLLPQPRPLQQPVQRQQQQLPFLRARPGRHLAEGHSVRERHLVPKATPRGLGELTEARAGRSRLTNDGMVNALVLNELDRGGPNAARAHHDHR